MMTNYSFATHGAFVINLSILLALLGAAAFLSLKKEVIVDDGATFRRHLSNSGSENDGAETSFTTQVTFDEIYRVIIFIFSVHFAGELGALAKCPTLVGQIVCGIALGPQVMDFVPFEESLVLMGEMGLIVFLFGAGIRADITLIQASGTMAVMMSVICSGLAMGSGLGVGMALGADFQGSFSIGASFAQTAIATCGPVLLGGDLLSAPIGQMILSACMIDNMIALTLLSVMASFNSTEENLPTIHCILPIISSISWMVVLGYLAICLAPRIVDEFILPKVHRRHHYLIMYALMAAVTLTYMPLLKYTKSSYLMGATLAGMTFSQCKVGAEAFSQSRIVHYWLMKLFFAGEFWVHRERVFFSSVSPIKLFPASIGFQIPVQLFYKARVWYIGLLFVATAVLIKVAAAFFVPKFQEGNAIYNLHRRDQILAALSMASRGGFGYLISAFGFNANLIGAEMYASVVLAILIATIFPSYLMSFVVTRYAELLKPRGQTKKGKGKTILATDGEMSLYLRINMTIRGKSGWGLLQKVTHEFSSIGLAIEDIHSRPVQGGLKYIFYLRHDSIKTELGKEESSVRDRLIEIRHSLEENLNRFEPSIEVFPWDPSDPITLEVLEILTRDDGEEPGLEFFLFLFKIIDKDGDGELTIDELEEGLRASHINVSRNELELIMKMMDRDGDGSISFDEWEKAISHLLGQKSARRRSAGRDEEE